MSQSIAQKFCREYPGKSCPIGLTVTTRHNSSFDREYLAPELRKSAVGKITNYSNSHGLSFEVQHQDNVCAWYEPSEVGYDLNAKLKL